MTCLSQHTQYVRTKVCWSSYNRLSEMILSNYPGKPEVTQFDLREIVSRSKEDILWFEIAVDNILGVEILEGSQDLDKR